MGIATASASAGSPLLLLHGGGSSIPEKWIPLFTPVTASLLTRSG